MEIFFGLLYSSYLYFECLKIASLCQCFCVFIFLSCAAKNSVCHLGISRLLSCRFRGHDMTNKEYALRRGVQWTFSIHSAYSLKNQSQNKKLSGSVWIRIISKLVSGCKTYQHFVVKVYVGSQGSKRSLLQKILLLVYIPQQNHVILAH